MDEEKKPTTYWVERPNIFNPAGTKSDTFVWTYPSRKQITGVDKAVVAKRRSKNRAARQARKVNWNR